MMLSNIDKPDSFGLWAAVEQSPGTPAIHGSHMGFHSQQWRELTGFCII
jgi:hypothetical protein